MAEYYCGPKGIKREAFGYSVIADPAHTQTPAQDSKRRPPMEYSRDDLRIGELLAPEFIELLDQKDTAGAREALLDLLEPQVADVLIALPPKYMAIAFRLLPRQKAADVFTLLPEDQQQLLL